MTEINHVVSAVSSNDSGDHLQRRAPRHPYTVKLQARLLDEEYRPTSESFTVIARNLSMGGLSILNDEALPENSLIGIDLNKDDGSQIKIVMRVLRSRDYGGMFEMSGSFVCKMS